MAHSAFAQDPDARIDRNEILIGQQAVITLSCRINKENPEKIIFPTIADTLTAKVEVVKKTHIDTLKTGENVKETRLEQKLYITSFDTGYYAIRPFQFKVNGEVRETQAFLLTVQTVEIDTTGFIRDEKGIYTVDVTLLDYLNAYWKYPAAGLALVAILALVWFLVRRYRNKPRPEPEPVEEKDLRPADVIALEALHRIAAEEIFKRGKIKEYHTEITGVLRDYLQAVFGIPAHELTTRQIMDQLRYSGISDGSIRQLRTILLRADMVKFAKEIPSDPENVLALRDAETFVKATRPAEKPAEEAANDKPDKAQDNSHA